MPNTKSPARVSIIMTFYNSQAFLAEAIDSVLAQTFADFELILVDDGSSDASSGIARDYSERDSRLRCICHPGGQNRGVSESRNLGLGTAHGELVAYLDSDDVWLEAKLEEQVAIMDAEPDIGLVCGVVNYWSSWNGGTDLLIQSGGLADEKLSPPETLLVMYPVGRAASPPPSDILVRKGLIDQTGHFEPAVPNVYDDQAFLVKAYLEAPIFCASRNWTQYRLHPASDTGSIHGSREYFQKRRNFYQWLRAYLTPRKFVHKPEIMGRIDREMWLLDRLLLWKIDWRIRRFMDRIFPVRTSRDGIIRQDR